MRDEAIIERVLSGRTQEYRQLMQRYQQRLFRIALHITGSQEDAEDAVLQAFVSAYSSLGECRDRSRFGAWVRRILVNICLRLHVRELPVDRIEDSGHPFPPESPVEQEVLRRARADEIREAVAALPLLYRAVVVLRYEEDMELKEIAALLGEQPGTIYTRLHRAKKMLARKLRGKSDEMCRH